jgi:hypothetical protein
MSHVSVISVFRHVSCSRIKSRKRLSDVDVRVNCVARLISPDTK